MSNKDEYNHFIINNWEEKNDIQMAEELKIKPKYVKKLRLKLDLKRSLDTITKKEYEYLLQNKDLLSIKDIAKNLKRDPYTITNWLVKFFDYKLNKNLWSKEEVLFLKQNYDIMTDAEISLILNRTVSGIEKQRRKLSLKKTRRCYKENKWSNKEIFTLIRLHNTKKISEISKYISRSEKAISLQLHRLGLVKHKRWSEEEDLFLKTNYKEYSFFKLSSELNRTVKSIKHRKKVLNLTEKPKMTSPEHIIYNCLKKINLKFEYQVKIKPYIVDFIVDNKIIIEVQGDYWHCNPKIYPNGPINETQKEHMERDPIKKAYLNKLGYSVIYIWENDLNLYFDNIEEYLMGRLM